MNKYNQAPLPFQGQKRRFLNKFKSHLEQFDGKDVTIVDLFGGSGLLSHTAKRMLPQAKVVYNDFDNYQERIKQIPQTNEVLHELRGVLEGYPRNKRIVGSLVNDILEIVKNKTFLRGGGDYITISTSLLFSAKYATSFEDLAKQSSGGFYNKVRISDYDATGYLDGTEVVREDYRKLFKRYADTSEVVFLLDPPYLSTDTKSYSMNWRLSDYLDVLRILKSDTNFFYFTSEKSQIIELCAWMGNYNKDLNPFEKSKIEAINTSVNYNSKYRDIMVVNLN